MLKIKIRDGTNQFNLRGLKDCTFFEYNNRSKFLVWEMNWNTLMNYFVGKIPKGQILYFRHYQLLSRKLEKGEVDESNVKELITPLLKSFTNGTYKIEFRKDYADAFIVKTGVTTYFSNGKDHVEKGTWVGGSPFIYAIQDFTDEERVEYYIDLIKKGFQPQVILIKLENSEINFILDGHHKLEACQIGYESMNAIQITKMDNYESTEEEVYKVFDKTGEVEDYRIRLKDHLNRIKNTTTNKR
jgi:hypothetical protein